MSKFDFDRLRAQIKQSGEDLRKTFRTTDNRMQGNQLAQQTREASNVKEKVLEGIKTLRNDPKRSAELNKKSKEGLNRVKETEEYWQNYYQGIERREKDKSYHQERIKQSNAVICRRVHTPLGDFDSITLAAKAHNMNNTETMRNRLKSPNFPDYYHLDNNLRPKKK